MENECTWAGDPALACTGEVAMRAVAFPAEPEPFCEAHWEQTLDALGL